MDRSLEKDEGPPSRLSEKKVGRKKRVYQIREANVLLPGISSRNLPFEPPVQIRWYCNCFLARRPYGSTVSPCPLDPGTSVPFYGVWAQP